MEIIWRRRASAHALPQVKADVTMLCWAAHRSRPRHALPFAREPSAVGGFAPVFLWPALSPIAPGVLPPFADAPGQPATSIP